MSGGIGAIGNINLNATNSRGPVSLPSGLGAGGRGKEKAPCRYLHYEVDWDGDDRKAEQERENERGKGPIKKPFKLGIGLGPSGLDTKPVRSLSFSARLITHQRFTAAPSSMDQLRLAKV